MFDNPFSMVVAIVLIVAIAGVFKARYGHRRRDEQDAIGTRPTIESEQLRGEIKQLKDRIAVLERVITDDRQLRDLAKEIEDLRGPR